MFFKIQFCVCWFIRIKASKISNLSFQRFPFGLKRLRSVIQKMFQEFLFFFESFNKSLKSLQINSVY